MEDSWALGDLQGLEWCFVPTAWGLEVPQGSLSPQGPQWAAGALRAQMGPQGPRGPHVDLGGLRGPKCAMGAQMGPCSALGTQMGPWNTKMLILFLFFLKAKGGWGARAGALWWVTWGGAGGALGDHGGS